MIFIVFKLCVLLDELDYHLIFFNAFAAKPSVVAIAREIQNYLVELFGNWLWYTLRLHLYIIYTVLRILDIKGSTILIFLI